MALVTVTDEAAKRIRALLEKEGKFETHGLRMKVIGGGCSGLQYQLAFDDQMNENDTQVEVAGVRIVVDEKSGLYLAGSTLDFEDSLMSTGFRIDNPNASSTCGCGDSFSA